MTDRQVYRKVRDMSLLILKVGNSFSWFLGWDFTV